MRQTRFISANPLPILERIRLPKMFFAYLAELGTALPKVVRENQMNYVVFADDPLLPQLLATAEFFVSPAGPDDDGLRPIKTSAWATIRAIRTKQKQRSRP